VSNILSRQEQYSGCLLGGAIGDALGAPVEFLSLDQIKKKFGEGGITDFYPAYGKLGAITDDTQMILFTAEGLLRGLVRRRERGISGAEVAIVHDSYLRWLETQKTPFNPELAENNGWLITIELLRSRRAPGNTCISALAATTTLGEPANNDSKGCGTVMRVAPIGLLYDDELAYRMGRQTSALTHGHPTASTAAGALCVIISQLRKEVPLDQAVKLALAITKDDEIKQCMANETSQAIDKAISFAQGSEAPRPELIETLGAGWIAEEALAISIYCALVARNFAHGVLLAVNHSGDSDSTGAITGNLLGIIYGQKGIPQHLQEQVELREVLEQIAFDLVDIPHNFYLDGNDEYHTQIFQRYPGS
jgi:ADP-ribosyl-[dinitrogen reductase] hydrolase